VMMLMAVVVASGARVRRRQSDAQQVARLPAAEMYQRRGWAASGMAWSPKRTM
jgi:hypothetical protein